MNSTQLQQKLQKASSLRHINIEIELVISTWNHFICMSQAVSIPGKLQEEGMYYLS